MPGRTMPEAMNQNKMDMGSEIIYLTRPVKLRRRKKLPAKPQARDRALRTISLRASHQSAYRQRLASNSKSYQRGSWMPTPLSSVPSGSWPLLGRVTLQGVTRAATERTLESGPMVAESRGMAVEANHHCLRRMPSMLSRGLSRPGGRRQTHCGRLSLRARNLSGPRFRMVSDRSRVARVSGRLSEPAV